MSKNPSCPSDNWVLITCLTIHIFMNLEIHFIVEKAPARTIYWIIIAVFLLKLVFKYFPFDNQLDAALKKLRIFLFRLPDH